MVIVVRVTVLMVIVVGARYTGVEVVIIDIVEVVDIKAVLLDVSSLGAVLGEVVLNKACNRKEWKS